MKSRNILVWFRNDLRLHDIEMLVEAIAKSDKILPVYFFDPRHFVSTEQETFKTGVNRAKFLLESVGEIRKAFQGLGGDILLIKGKPEDELPLLVEQMEITEVYHHREVAVEETDVSTHAEDILWKHKVNLKHFIGHTLYNKEDLPFPIKDIPDVFTQFKKKTERDAIVKPCILSPSEITFVETEHWGDLPNLADLGFDPENELLAGDGDIRGGENEGLLHLESLLMLGSDLFQKSVSKGTVLQDKCISKLSSWLSLGCLSPRKVYWMIKEAENLQGSNAYFNQVLLGLLWRDYFRFMFKKHGRAFCNTPDLDTHLLVENSFAPDLFMQWKNGDTGHPLVDKYMVQLNTTGFIPHSARLLVATFLIYFLKVDWTLGAAYFEEKLIDYASASNWGNWAIVAAGGENKQNKSAFSHEKYMKLLEAEGAASKTLV